jgi:methionine aminopeptidase
MTYGCPAWEFVTDTHLMKLQLLQNNALYATGKSKENSLIQDMHMTFQIPYVYNYITKLCGHQVQVIQIHETANVCSIGQGRTQYRKYKRLNVSRGHISSDYTAIVA